jgi:hypothetical protein
MVMQFKDKQWGTVQENYEHWDTNGRNAKSGKQLCLNLSPRIFEVFFDDCISRKDLVHVVDADGTTMDKIEAITRGHLVNVDTIEAIYDDEYFIKQLIQAYARYSDSLQRDNRPALKFSV